MKIQLESGQSSSATHSLTRPSATLNRRYVSKPSNLAIEEAALAAKTRPKQDNAPSTPSRLVNLRIRNADLAKLNDTQPTAYQTYEPPATFVPQIVEFGTDTSSTATYDPVSPTPASQPAPDLKDLAMNIAADYTTASLSASTYNLPAANDASSTDMLSAAIREQHASESIDEIARTASEAIAAIRAATDPSDIAEQITALENFAENIKASSNIPEIAELGTTIEKFIEIASKATGVQEEINRRKLLANQPQPIAMTATSLPAVTKSPAKTIISHSARVSKPTTKTLAHPAKSLRNSKPATLPRQTARSKTRSRQTAIDNDAALRKALNSVATMDDEEPTTKRHHRTVRKKGGAKRVLLAFSCAAACVAAIIYFVGTNVPDISVRVAAMQTGVDASYPSYIPNGYSLSEINSENGKITLTFNHTDGKSFTLIEEKSSWDSAALLRNYVEPTWSDSYTTTHEQGITIYIYGSNAAWVNGGVLYKINTSANNLTKKQLRNIVTSMQ